MWKGAVAALICVGVCAAQPASAQDAVPPPRLNLSLGATTVSKPDQPSAVAGDGGWRIESNVRVKQKTFESAFDDIPVWNLGFRAERQLSRRFAVGGLASVTRGQNGPLMLSTEIGTGRDLSHPELLTGPGAFRTVLNTGVTVSVPLKESGHVKMKAVGELWNPFLGDQWNASSSDSPLRGRALRLGTLTTF